ncbi:hypothetical protein CAC42_7127 [Sphaceloma murrayae]|uniref:Glycosyl transferase CAP10 domain-containing protein n=1 Tax=Sphaceloma murrayae TaxID=2082308 RepID=A0A2K1QQT1_9PEZI|nr:hypothetical protein CAC42_7127 [Sphaceloma murrayae]
MRRILTTLALVFFLLLTLFFIHRALPSRPPISLNPHPSSSDLTTSLPLPAPNTTLPWTYIPSQHAHRLTLSRSQCLSSFPHLYNEIHRAASHRRHNVITPSDLTTAWRGDGIVHALIHAQQLYVLEARAVSDRNHRPRHLATLHALHRALSASTEDLPDIEFTITDHDSPDFGVVRGQEGHTTWAYSRLPDQENLWLVPDFGFWGWPDVNLRSYGEVRRRIGSTGLDDGGQGEGEVQWAEKEDKLVWRGSVNVGSRDVRTALLEQSKGMEWSSVFGMDWGNGTDVKSKLIGMEDHCRYKFVAQTEGNTYSARLKYLLNCGSLVISHEARFLEHFTHLLRKEGSEQNYVQVKRDWRDLKGTMKWLLTEEGDERAEEVARRSKEVFRDRYLSPAAEACYWRELVRGWSEVQGFTPQFWEEVEVDEDGEKKKKKKKKTIRKPRGVPFESYAIMEAVDWTMPSKPRKICEYD